jgi:hypothetical protein
MPTKPVRKESAAAKKVRLLENKIKKLEKRIQEVERKIDHVYDIDDAPRSKEDRLNKPIHP